MIERKIVAQKMKENEIEHYIVTNLKNAGHSSIKLQKTPLGEKIIIAVSHPGLIVGRKGQNIKKLTEDLKVKFELENPQIEINEVENQNLDANIIAQKIASSLEKFGASRFKGVMHKTMEDVMRSGAKGVEIIVAGRGLPSSRAKSWRVFAGYLKKCGDVAESGVQKAQTTANLRSGTIGIKVRIMPPNLDLPDRVDIKEIIDQMDKESSKEEAPAEKEEKKSESKPAKEDKKPKKKAARKKSADKEDKKPEAEE